MALDGESTSGWLALVATPIGNLEDMTLRAIRTLREADLIAAEDTRRARRLCLHYEIDTPLTPYHAFNEHRRTHELLDRVERGARIVVLSDAGTPAISDPGFLVVREAMDRGVQPVVIPGVSAVTFAVVAAGLPVDRFLFAGFPPVKAGKRRRFLEELGALQHTAFLFESPHRIGRLLREVADVLGPDTLVAVVREATKCHEEVLRGRAADLVAAHAEKKWKGEIVVGLDLRNWEGAAEPCA